MHYFWKLTFFHTDAGNIYKEKLYFVNGKKALKRAKELQIGLGWKEIDSYVYNRRKWEKEIKDRSYTCTIEEIYTED